MCACLRATRRNFIFTPQRKPLPYPVLFDNNRGTAFRITELPPRTPAFKKRGPIIVELVKGSSVFYHQQGSAKEISLKQGKYFYIPPGQRFYFTSTSNSDLNMVLFEIK
jgi:hypothetical protein